MKFLQFKSQLENRLKAINPLLAYNDHSALIAAIGVEFEGTLILRRDNQEDRIIAVWKSRNECFREIDNLIADLQSNVLKFGPQ